MTPITKLLSEARFRIPLEILNEVFLPKQTYWRGPTPSLDEMIKSKVITPRLLVDVNMVGGIQTMVSLEGLPSQEADQFMSVYHIPKDRTQGKTISSVLSVSYLTPAMISRMPALSNFASCSVTPTLMAAQAMIDSVTPIPVSSSARVELVGENTIVIRDLMPILGSTFIRCILDADENMSNLRRAAYPVFCRLGVMAIKSYIYNNHTVSMDQGQIQFGSTIGRFKEIIDSYADAEEMYQEYLTGPWAKVNMMNDHETHTRLIKLGAGGYR